MLNYIGCIIMALFVTLVVDGTIGMVLTYALVIAPIVSFVMTFIVKRGISVKPVLSEFAVSKGDRLSCEIKLINSSLLPAPLISAEIENTAHFSSENADIMSGSVTGKGVNTLSFPLTAVHSGKAHIRIKNLSVCDYLGLFTFKLKLPEELSDLTVSVYPNIPDAAVETSFMKTAFQLTGRDDDEEESEEVAAVPTGLAGYDHREYVPGDPIKRINWKMSSKRDILMVRLDERIKGAGRTFLLDCPLMTDNDITLTIRDNVIEGALAMLGSLLAEGRDAVFYYCKQGMWMSVDIHVPADIYALQEELSDFEASVCSQTLPPELAADSKIPICFTAATAHNLSSAEAIISAVPDTMIIGSYAASLPVITANQWVLSSVFELKKA